MWTFVCISCRRTPIVMTRSRVAMLFSNVKSVSGSRDVSARQCLRVVRYPSRVGKVISCVRDSVCLSLSALKGNRLELSTPESEVDYMAGPRHALTFRWKGQRSKSQVIKRAVDVGLQVDTIAYITSFLCVVQCLGIRLKLAPNDPSGLKAFGNIAQEDLIAFSRRVCCSNFDRFKNAQFSISRTDLLVVTFLIACGVELQTSSLLICSTRSIWKMLGPFATASRRTPPVLILHCHSPGVATVDTTTNMSRSQL